MKKLANKDLIDLYYKMYDLDHLFSNDIKPWMELFRFNRNEHICTDRQRLDHIFFFVKGKAKVYRTLSNGKSLLLCFYSPLKILGDLELVSNKAITSNVQALTDSYCLGIHMDAVKEHLSNDLKFYKFISASLGEKLDRSTINSSINLLCELENRLASYILATSIDVNHNCGTLAIFDENLTHTAELLGTSYRHLLRTISCFCNANILRKNNGFYEIVNKRSLEELATDLYK